MLSGRVNRRGYADYLLRLRVIYEALEVAVRAHRDDPLVAAVYDPSLERLAAIDADLEYWAPGETRESDSAAALAYRHRLAAPLGWSAGGSPLHPLPGRPLRRTGDRQDSQPHVRIGRSRLAFYHFPVRPKPYKDAYRARLDALDLADDAIDRAVDEVRVAFSLNQALFDELAQNLPAYRH